MKRRDVNEAGLKPVDDAVATVLTECRRDFLRFLDRRLNDPANASVVLEGFFHRALGADTWPRQARNLRAWLGRALQSAVIEHNRTQSAPAQGGFPFRPTIHAGGAPEEEFDAVVCACLYKLLPTLRAEYAEIVWQADLIGISRDRVAALLGTTVNNVGVRLHRARRALRRRLTQTCVTCPTHGFLNCGCMPAAAPASAAAADREEPQAPARQAGSAGLGPA